LDAADSRHLREAEVMDFLLLTCHKNSQNYSGTAEVSGGCC
jgi:hypothetical protein